jgi:3-oxoacyl-[acyl-carrier protein] reductase
MTATDHVAIVTGGASGIGLAAARRLSGMGIAVMIADLNAEAGAAAAEALGARVGFVKLDVASREGWAEAVAATEAALGQPDILVSNAGLLRDRSLLKMTDEDWERVIAVNLKATFLGAQALLPGMRELKFGRIVVTSSSARFGNFGQANYAAAKAGLIGLMRTLAVEGLKHNILANAVVPHNVDTPILGTVPPEMKAEWMAKAKTGRFATPDEIAYAIAFFASPENTFITGQALTIDGGDLVGLP